MNLSIEDKVPEPDELERLLQEFIAREPGNEPAGMSDDDSPAGGDDTKDSDEEMEPGDDFESDFSQAYTPEPSAYEQLMAMTGLEEVKAMVAKQVSYRRIMAERRRRGRRTPARLLHMILTGNPGCGKTTVARLIGRIYKDAGILSTGHFVETNRAQLVGKYIGDTEANTTEMINAARGGVLFIDEIYSLVEGNDSRRDFGFKVIDTLMPVLSNPDSDLMVIGAGYPHSMRAFLASNPGLASRFPFVLNFPDFTVEQLEKIALDHLASYDFILAEEAERRLRSLIKRGASVKDSGNARMVMTMIENHIIPNLCSRLDSATDDAGDLAIEQLSLIEPEDLPDFSEIFPLAGERSHLGFVP